MQIEDGQARVLAFGLPRREKAATVGEGQQIADLRLAPASIADTLCQDPVEQIAAPSREQPRAQVALYRQLLPLGIFACAMNVAALEAEVVGHTLRLDALETRLQLGTTGVQLGQAQGEAVGRMSAALQLALVAASLEDLQGLVLGLVEDRIGLARQVQAEPLARQRLAVLEARIADAAQRHAGSAGDATGRFLGIEVALLDPKPEMLAFAGQGNVQHLIDLEILGHGLEHGAATRPTVCPWPLQLFF